MKKLILLLFLNACVCFAFAKAETAYTTKSGVTITTDDSVRILKPPFIFTYPRPNVDKGTQLKYQNYLERTMFNKTYKIQKLYKTKARSRKMVDVIILNVDGASKNFKDVEFYIEIEKALESGEVEIVKK